MSQSARVAAVFVELADTLADSFDLVDYTQLLTERCVELLAADASGLMLVDSRGDLRLMAATVDRARSLEMFELQIDEGPCLDCYSSGTAITNVDLRESGAEWPTFTPAALEAGFRSTHALPMRLRSQVVGALNLFTDASPSLSDEDLSIAQSMAEAATIGILQRRSVHDHTVLAEQLQRALDSRVLVEQAKGMIAARAQISVSEAFNRMRSHARRHGLPLTNVASAVVEGSLDEGVLPQR